MTLKISSALPCPPDRSLVKFWFLTAWHTDKQTTNSCQVNGGGNQYTWGLLLSGSAELVLIATNSSISYMFVRVRPIPVSGIGRYSPVLVGIGIGADSSSPVVRLPFSTVITVATHAYSFKPIPYFRAYTPYTYITCTHLYPTQNHFFSTKNLYSQVSVSV